MTRLPLFLDTEFTGLQQQSSLISLALVMDENHYFYAEFNDVDDSEISDCWSVNVIQKLRFNDKASYIESVGQQILMKGSIEQIRERLETWIAQFSDVEIWADVLAYDWVLFCNLFGNAFQLPANILYIPFDMATVLKIKGINPDIKRTDLVFDHTESLDAYLAPYQLTHEQQHNALFDSVVLKKVYEKIVLNESSFANQNPY